jgi:hypothetical protein
VKPVGEGVVELRCISALVFAFTSPPAATRSLFYYAAATKALKIKTLPEPKRS